MPVLKPQCQGLFKFCITVQCHISSLFFLSQTFTLWAKRAHRSEVFRLLSGWVKIHQIPYVMFETTSQFFFKLFITLQCHEKIFCTFLAETVHDLYFHWLLLLKVYRILAKKVQRSYVS